MSSAALRTPGLEIGPLEIPAISRTTLALFAGASGDHNPMHIDLDVARSAGLDDVFAHGMLSMAYLARLVTDTVPQSRLKSFRTKFAAITPVHGQPTCRGVVTSVEGDTATIELTVSLADGTITLRGDAVIDLTSD